MILLSLLAVPLAGGVAAFVVRSDAWRRRLLACAAILHTALTLAAWRIVPAPVLGEWLVLDRLGLFFLTITSLLFLACAVYGLHYLRTESAGRQEDAEESFLFVNAPEARFTGCLLLFLAAMTLVLATRHLAILWIGIEATTLASAPLIYFHRHHRSLEATWKYLLICSVGIALALLGIFFLALSASVESGASIPLTVDHFVGHAASLNGRWMKAAFLCFLVGYGTKMGLAPMHTWLPDAHSEAPSMVSALLSGALLNCAMVGILRLLPIYDAAGYAAFCQSLLVKFGLFSMLVAAVFIIAQRDFKRMLAYSSVEHMGILALGIGIGGLAKWGAVLHAVNHSLAKAMMFLLAGNILRIYKTKTIAEVKGMLRRAPVTAALWTAGFLAIAGAPPFGIFLSEFIILRGMFQGGHFWAGGAYLLLLSVIFVGMAGAVTSMTQGESCCEGDRVKEPFLSFAPSLVFAVFLLITGLWIPPFLQNAVEQASRIVGVF
ncbi:MAG: proton-conducting transporter membrane subunit [Candidatus Omnitrophota bacterium]|jgi:hydrogenase-4 component F